jgi:hypothetical protein
MLSDKKHFLLLTFAFILFTSGCSPHSGAGNWQANGSNSLKLLRIKVTFEGTADFYVPAREESVLRCFWSAIDKNKLNMQCVHAEDTSNKENYQFTIIQKGHAKLTQNDQLIGLFSESTP